MEDHIVEYVPQSSPKSASDDSEEPEEEDLEQECEEDQEQESEEDQEEECEEDQEQESEEDEEQESEEDQEQESEDEQKCEEDQEQECEKDQEEECEDDQEQECEEDQEEECEQDEEQECEDDQEQECEQDQEHECEDDQEQECEEDQDDELEEDQDVGCEEENLEVDLEEVEDELEEDQVLSLEEDPEEESSVELSEESSEEPSESISPDEDVSKVIASKPSSHGEIDGNEHPSRSNDNEKKFKQEEVEPDVGKQQEHTGSSGKRRRSRWDQNDRKTGLCNETGKRRKTRWSPEVSDLKMLGPIQLPNCVKGLPVNDVDPKIEKLKLKLSALNTKLLSSELQNHSSKMKKLASERQRVISSLIKKITIFHAVSSDTPPKFLKKLYVPVKEYPAYNFVGILIGPRGNTQKKLEQETGARIVLRGKGSVKQPGKIVDKSDNEDMHVLIEADDQKSLDAAVEKVEKLLIPLDEGMNDHKRAQLAELAKLKGTYKDGNACSVCKQAGHKDYACPNQQSSFKTVITCAKCGSFSHPSSSCPGFIPNTKAKPNDTNLFVGYLPQGVDEIRLKELFSPFGKITEAIVIMDRNTGQSKGYGFVKFESSIHAASAVTHMNGLRLEKKVLAVRLAGRPQPPGAPPGALSQLPIYPGPPAGIYANVPSHLRHLPMYPGPVAPISGNVLNVRALPEPPGYMLPEAKSSFQINEGLGLPSSSILPPVVSSSQHASGFDSYYRYPNQTPLSSPGFTSQFLGDRDYYPGSQLLSGSSTLPMKPVPPPYYSSYAPRST